MKDPHPGIRHQANLDGWPDGADIDADAFNTYQEAKAVLNPPEKRANALTQIDVEISKTDATNLRQKSQLLTLRRRLANAHSRLLLLGR